MTSPTAATTHATTPTHAKTATHATSATAPSATAPSATAPDDADRDADTLDAEIRRERAHLAASRAALARMRERAQHLFSTGEKVAGDAYSAETLGRTLSRRVAELSDDPNTPLFFGRLAFGDTPAQSDHSGHQYHIGRRHVTDDSGEPMVIDWRAPVSRAFYQASARDPRGVAVRRRFGFVTGTLTGFEDERLDRGEELGIASRILTAEIERPRIGPMRDIVATIQPDQDELVRAELSETICVQGAPGTGKTAVGLHRAAYLLYLHRERLRRSGVLVIGPNHAFLRYICAVLPALGEVEVTQSTVDQLVASVPVGGSDEPEVAALKHDPRLAGVLARALARLVREPEAGLTISDGSWRWRVSEEALRRIVDDVRREHPPYAVGREWVRARTVALLQRQAEARSGESPTEAWLRQMGRHSAVRAFLDHAWPDVSAESLVWKLLADATVLADCADGILSADEQALLVWRRRPRSVRATRWSAADAILIDEAAGLIDRVPSFGHIVVDEAQDLSPMQCRAIARRSEHGSITLLGDLAQGTATWAARDWRDTLVHLGKPDARVVPLTTGFRVPEAVLALANRLLPALDVAVPEAVSLRRDGWLAVHHVADIHAATVEQVRAALDHEGSVAVIAADAAVPGLISALAAAGIEAATPGTATPGTATSGTATSGTATSGTARPEPAAADSTTPDAATPDAATPDAATPDARVTVLPASLAKGLEYDHVVVVEPAEIVAAEARGLHRLYVVLTRAVSRLAVVHTRPLPPPLVPRP